MQCSQCGFVMSELDAECLRCRRQGTPPPAAAPPPDPAPPPPIAEEKECPRCGKAAPAEAAACDKCGYVYGTAESRAERYQARLALEAAAAPPSALRQTLPPAVGWGIIAACLAVVLGAGWAMFGGIGSDPPDSTLGQPVILARRHKPRPALVGLQNVTYSLTGTAASANVSYGDAAPAVVELPWTLTVKARPGAHLILAASPADGTGQVLASLKVNGVLRKQSYTPAADGQIMVEDTL